MSLFQIFCFFFLTFIITLRIIIYKNVAVSIPPLTICLYAGLSMVFLPLILLLLDTLTPASVLPVGSHDIAVWTNPVVLTAGLLKGLFLAGGMYAHQKLIKDSLSSTTYCYLVGGALVAVLHYFFLDVNLSFIQLIGILGLGLCGLAFVLFGHVRDLGRNGITLFLAQIVLFILYGFCDHFALKNANWLIYMLLVGVGMSSTSLIALRGRFPKLTLSRFFGVTGTWVVTEMVIYMILVTVLPVAIAMFALNLRVLILMPLASRRYAERSLGEQVLFALAGLVAAGLVLFGG